MVGIVVRPSRVDAPTESAVSADAVAADDYDSVRLSCQVSVRVVAAI